MAVKAYFIKHGVSRVLRDSRGIPFPFRDVGDETGILELDTAMHAPWVKELTAHSGKAGVLKVSPEQYAETKKNCNERRLQKSLKPGVAQKPVRVDSMFRKQSPNPVAAPVAKALTIPDQIPPPEKPSSEKVYKRRGRPPKALPSDSLSPIPMKAPSSDDSAIEPQVNEPDEPELPPE